jgi:NAD+ synthase
MNSPEALNIDPAKTCSEICLRIEGFLRQLRRRGAVLGISGGVDSAVVAALCVRALGKDRLLGLFMPEAESSPDSLRLGRLVGASLGIATCEEDITPILTAAGCYLRRDDAIRSVIPHYDSTYKCKLVVGGGAYRLFSIVIRSAEGIETRARLPLDAYLAIVAATNFKQRTRKMIEYYHADRLNYAVAGSPNRLEYDQGFFVKNGDGSADFKPIAHLYKSQVYQLAEYLEIPEEIRLRPPSTDTYSLEQSQEEFYFSLPYRELDIAIHGLDNGVPPAGKIHKMIEAKRRAANYLHLPPLTMFDLEE